MKYFIGLDAHSKTCTFVTLDKEGEEIEEVIPEPTEEDEIYKEEII